MITCKRAAERLSNALDGELPFGSRLALAIHRVLCAKCRRYGRLLDELDRGADAFFDESAVALAGLTVAAAERIKRALRSATQG